MISKLKLKHQRKVAGLSQAALAETSGISIRTIQRIEKGLSEGSPYTLTSLAQALGIQHSDLIPDKLALEVDNTKDKSYLRLLNLSALAVIFLPLGNIILPALLLRKYQDRKEIKINGRRILSFHIWWLIFTLFLVFLLPPALNLFTDLFRGGGIPVFVLIYVISVAANVCFTLRNAVRINARKQIMHFVPSLL